MHNNNRNRSLKLKLNKNDSSCQHTKKIILKYPEKTHGKSGY